MQASVDILKAIQDLEKKVDQNRDAIRDDIFELKEEIILNRDEIAYVKDLKRITTVSNLEDKLKVIDDLVNIKMKVIGGMIVISFIWSLVFWFISRKLL
jgi:hypothetical protein